MWSCVVASLVPSFPDSDDKLICPLPSVCVFFVALLLFSFQNATTHIRASVAATAGFVTILILWCIISCWESDSGDSERDEIVDILPDDESHTA